MFAPPPCQAQKKVGRNQPGADYDERQAEVKSPGSFKRRVKSVKDGRLPGEHRKGCEHRAHSDRGKSGNLYRRAQGASQRASRRQADESVGESEGQHDRVEDAVNGQPLIVGSHLRVKPKDVDAGVAERLVQTVDDSHRQCRKSQVDGPAYEVALDAGKLKTFASIDDGCAHFTLSTAVIV
jgi:hypothetical protein